MYNAGDGRERYGFIAEDAAAVDAHFATYDASGAISGIDDRSILAAIVGAVKDLWTKVAALMQSDDEQNARIQQLEADVAALKSQGATGDSSGEHPEPTGGTSTSSPSADDESIPPNSDTATTTSATTTAATPAATNDEEPATPEEPAADDQAPEQPEVQHAEPTPAADPTTAEADADTSLSETAELPAGTE